MNNNIEKYGYNDFFERQIDELNISSENLMPARVIEVQKEQYKLVTEYGENAGLHLKEKAKWKSMSKFQKQIKRRI